MKLRECRGDRDPGGSMLIQRPATGEIVRVHRRAFLATSVVVNPVGAQNGVTFLGTPEDAWIVSTVEPGINPDRPGGEQPSRVYWSEPGWEQVMATGPDENGHYVARREVGGELEPG